MNTFSRLNLLTLLFLGIVLMLVGGTTDVYAQETSLQVTGDTGTDKVYDVGDRVETVFTATDTDGEAVEGADLTITHVGLTDVTISNGGTTDEFGEVVVRGLITSSCVFVRALWPEGGNDGLRAEAWLAGCLDIDIDPSLWVDSSVDDHKLVEVGDEVTVRFFVDPPDEIPLHVSVKNVEVISIWGANDHHAPILPSNYTTNRGGELVVTGVFTGHGDAFIQARWDDPLPHSDILTSTAVFEVRGPLPPTIQVFNKYKETFKHPDVHEHFPDVLRAFKNPEIQNVLNSVVIHHFVRDPEYIRAFSPDVDASIITLLTTDNGFRTLFEDEGFQGVLQEPAEIDELVGFIESQPQREPRMLTIVSGDLQEGSPQTPLGNPLVVLVRDQYGGALSGVDVAFRVTRGGGSLSHTTVRTNRAGRAETTLTLASESGIHQVKASVVGFPSLTQTFTAASTGEVSPPPPEPSRVTGLSIVSGNNQSGEVGKPLAQPLVVGVLDQYGKPFAGIVVAFAVTLGGGQLSATRVMTDIYGQALTTLTLGSHVGRNLVTARAAGIIPQTFTATAIAPPKEPEPVEPERPSTDEPDQQLPPVVYWIEEGAIFRLDGGNKQALVEPSGGWTVTSLAMDMARNKLYWTERQTGKQMGSIWSGDLNDRNARNLQSITAVPKGIVVDAENDRLYWTNDRGKIQSINVNGSNFKGNFIKDLDSPKHIALGSGTLYWTAYDATADSWSIWFKRLGSSVTQKEIMRGLGELGGIAVDGDKLYWTEKVSDNQGKISSVSLNGSGAVTLFSLPGSVPLGLAVDGAGRRLYLTDNDGIIRSLNLDKPIEIEIVVRGSSDTPAVAIALGRSSDELIPASPAAPSTIAGRSAESALLANYPNPFNPETWIPYQLSASADVSVSIYAVDGRLVRWLDLGHQVAGVYRSRSRAAYWDGRNEFGERVASGLYFYTLTAGDFTATRKLLIRK